MNFPVLGKVRLHSYVLLPAIYTKRLNAFLGIPPENSISLKPKGEMTVSTRQGPACLSTLDALRMGPSGSAWVYEGGASGGHGCAKGA